MLDVCLLGTGGMMPLPGRFLTALMARFNGSSILIDCGEGTQVAIREKGWSFHDIDVICITHYHADHISGLPGLLLSMGNAERTEKVTILGPKGLERIVNSLRIIAPELPFSLEFIEIVDPVFHFAFHGYIIEAFRVNHNIICYGYSIKIRRAGRFMPEKASQNNVPQAVWSRLQKKPEVEHNGIVYTQDMILGAERKGIKVTYCTDTRPVSALIQSAKDADLLICEGMYGEKGKEAKAQEHKHMTFHEAAEIAKNAGVRELWLTHYSPSLVRPEDFMKEVRGIYSNAKPGKDGKTTVIEFSQE